MTSDLAKSWSALNRLPEVGRFGRFVTMMQLEDAPGVLPLGFSAKTGSTPANGKSESVHH